VDIICLQETKVKDPSRRFVRSLWGCNHVDWCCLDSSGASGGILIMWDKRVVEKVDVCVGVSRFQFPLGMLQIILSGVLRECMVRTSRLIGGGFGMSWLGSLVGEICLSV
jgi:exonuclease III